MNSDVKPHADLLEVFANPHPDQNYLIVHIADEFTSVCPVTGQPDFATLVFRYVANESCIELKSLKAYLQSYRNEGIFYEDVTNRILNDWVQRCAPRWISVESIWSVRGGMRSRVIVQHGDRSVVPITPVSIDAVSPVDRVQKPRPVES